MHLNLIKTSQSHMGNKVNQVNFPMFPKGMFSSKLKIRGKRKDGKKVKACKRKIKIAPNVKLPFVYAKKPKFWRNPIFRCAFYWCSPWAYYPALQSLWYHNLHSLRHKRIGTRCHGHARKEYGCVWNCFRNRYLKKKRNLLGRLYSPCQYENSFLFWCFQDWNEIKETTKENCCH